MVGLVSAEEAVVFFAIVDEGGDTLGVDFVLDDIFDIFKIIGNFVGVGKGRDFSHTTVGEAEFMEPLLEELFGLVV